MSVASTHPDYNTYSPKWKRCRDCVAGQDAIHAATTEYLPKLKDEDTIADGGQLYESAYKARLKRSDFFNGTFRTIAGLAGMAFRKPPTVEVPAGIKPYLTDVNMAGVALDALAMEALDEVLSVGRLGLLVDHSTQETDKNGNVVSITQAVAEQRGLRPTIQTYPTESIINWKFGRIANAWVLTMVVLKESEHVAEDEFKSKAEDRWRVLDLDAAGEYRQRLFRKVAAGEQGGEYVQIGGDNYPLMNGKKLTYIPFVIVGADGRGDKIDDPPLIDLVDANLALYQINADYRHGLHFTGLPTPVVSGYQPQKEGEKFYIGSMSAWVFPDPNAKAEYLEFKGEGLNALANAIKEKKLEMALLGARAIADESRHVETATGSYLKRQHENSVLSRTVQSVSEALEYALGIFAEWAGQKGKVVYQINRDFLPAGMDAQQLNALLAAVAAGEMSGESFFDILQRNDLIAPEVTYEIEQERIASSGPPAPVKPTPKAEPGAVAA